MTGSEVGVAWSPEARSLLDDASAGVLRRADVVGAGGHGKSVLLDALAVAFHGAGIPVHWGLPPSGGVPGSDLAVLVDDAHLLGTPELGLLVELARGKRNAALVVAHRPWPRPPGTAELGVALAADRPPVVLDVLDRAGVAARASLILDDRLGRSPALLDAVLRRTAGVPALVDRLLAALAEQPEADPALCAGDPVFCSHVACSTASAPCSDTSPAPAHLLAQLGYTVQGLPRRLHDLLLACALGAPLDAEVLVPILGSAAEPMPGGAFDDLVEAARSEGLLTAGGRAIPLVSAAVLARTPEATRLETRRALAELELGRGGNVLVAARGLLGTGAGGARVAAVFVAAAQEALRTGDRAEEFYEAAVLAGTPVLELAARRAEAAMRHGDVDLALAQADQVLSAPDQVPPADLVQAGTVAAAVLARRGMLARSAELYRWLGARLGSAAPLAVPALIGTGALAEARALLDPAATGGRAPTMMSGAEELMAHGVYESVAGSPTAAMSKLVRAATMLEPPHRAALLPDTPAALAALVAVHCGELDVAQSVLERALRTGQGGPGTAVRHRLLMGWIAMNRGSHAAARSALAATRLGTRLEPRDELLAAALEVALSRRASDPAALSIGWTRAREAIVHHPVDLFVLQPLAELAVAAARLREQSWVRPHLDEATALLGRLGDPPLWAAPLHWAGVHAAMFDDAPDVAERHVTALEAGASTSRYAAAMAVGARQWLNVLARTFDPVAVELAARRLHAVGLSWDAGKLAGQAAIRTADKKAMGALLATARALQNNGPASPAQSGSPVDGNGKPAEALDDGRDGPLSDREREVAVLVLEGLTYKQIGEELFISAKTVEHHVARMRQRLGSATRNELFANLRTIVGPATATDI